MTTTRRALVVVDVQNGFTENSGELPVAGGDAAAAAIGAYVSAHRSDYVVVATTQDHHIDPGTHFSDAPDFVDSWPVHCVAGTFGAELDEQLSAGAGRLFTELVDVAVYKGMYAAAYSGFEGVTAEGVPLAQALRSFGVDAVDVVGIATSFCVRATALDALAAGFTTSVLLPLCADVDEALTPATIAELTAAGITCADSTSGSAAAVDGGTVPAADMRTAR